MNFFDDRFYLKCLNAETGQVRTYRIDRMKNIIAGERIKKLPKLPKYNGVVLDMFEPERFENVTLKVKRFLLDDMLEQFGEYAGVREQSEDNEYIIICARIGISDSFYRWVMKYGSNIEILLPKDIRQCFIEKIREVFEKYQK